MKTVWHYWLPVFAYMSGITYLSSLSSPEEQIPLLALPLHDKILHAIEYAILGTLCFRAFQKAAGVTGARHAVSLAMLTATLFGVADEYHQSFVPLRQADSLDLLADFVGAALGIFIWQRIRGSSQERAGAT